MSEGLRCRSVEDLKFKAFFRIESSSFGTFSEIPSHGVIKQKSYENKNICRTGMQECRIGVDECLRDWDEGV